MEITKGLIMFTGGIAGIVATLLLLIAYVIKTKKEENNLFKQIEKEL